MDVLSLARLQFATTVLYHYLFVPLTLGLVIFIAIMETCYVVTNNATYVRMAKFWGQLYLINYALGIVTGIVQEFQFGMLWSNYSRFVGNVFGAPLAIETLLAFFIESTFLGIWIFGWELLPRKLHLTTIWLVTFGAYMSVFWILLANSFMQSPVGYVIHNGIAYMTSFRALLTNPNFQNTLPHVIASGLLTGSFFIISVSAYQILRKTREIEAFRRSLNFGLIGALLGTLIAIGSGVVQIEWVRLYQPMKWDAMINTMNSTDPSSPGMNQLQAAMVLQFGPGNYEPPTQPAVLGFHIMLIMGILFLLLALIGVFLIPKRRIVRARWFLVLLVPSVLLPYITNFCGWLVRETGRQPWIVYKLLTVQQGLTPNLTPVMLLLSLIGFVLLYTLLSVVDIILLIKYAHRGIITEKEEEIAVSLNAVTVFSEI
jgi:cytochrome d ubiquinol oxidase subunit I